MARQQRSRRRPSPETSSGGGVEEDSYTRAREIVLRQLTMAARSRVQLERALARRQIPPEVAAAVLDRFEEVDLVDDQAYAQEWVRVRHAGRGLARHALRHELRARGVAEEIVQEALEGIDPADELETARELVRRRTRTMPVPGDPQERVKQVKRLMAMLGRRGYGPETAGRAVREVLAGDPQQPDDDAWGLEELVGET